LARADYEVFGDGDLVAYAEVKRRHIRYFSV
jgi:hypothetical protein